MSKQQVTVELRAITGPYEAAMNRAAGTTSKFEKTAKGAGAGTSKLGSEVGMLAKRFLGPAALVAAVKTSATAVMSYEDALVGVGKTTGLAGSELSALGDELTTLGRKLEGSAEDMMGIAQTAAQLGVAKNDIVAFTEVIAGIATATDLTADQAASGMARLANIIDLPTDKFGNLGSALVALGNNMATTEPEILAMSTRIASAGRASGLSADQILGLAAAASELGLEAEAGGSALSMTLMGIQEAAVAGGPKLQTFAQIAGMSASQFAASWKAEPVAAFEAFLTGLDGVQQSGGNVAGVLDELGLDGLRVSDTLRRLSASQESVTTAMDLSGTAIQSTTDLMNEVEAATGRSSVALDNMKDSFDGVMRALMGGEESAGKLAWLFNGVSDALRGLEIQLDGGNWLDFFISPAWADGLRGVTGASDEATKSFGKQSIALKNTADGADKAMLGTARLNATSTDSVPAIDNLAGALLGQADAALAAWDANNLMADQLRASVDPAFAYVAAQKALRGATNDYEAALAEYGAESDEAADAALTLLDAQLALDGVALTSADSFAKTSAQIDRMEQSGRITAEAADIMRSKLQGAREEAERLEGDYKVNIAISTSGADRAMLQSARRIGSGGLQERAKGGPVVPGQPYLVGEEGPEIIVPQSAGQVLTAPDTSRIMQGRGTTAAPAGAATGGASVTFGDVHLSDGVDVDLLSKRMAFQLAMS